MQKELIKLYEVSKEYRLGKSNIVNALKNINLKINSGEFTAFVGPSGSGKSTLLNIIGCLDKPNQGKIIFDDEDITSKSQNELAIIRNRKIGFIFQTFNLFPIFDVYENIEFPFLVGRSMGNKHEDRKKIILNIIEQIGLTKYIRHKSNELSGGQMQRVAIGRALALSPLMVLADEPTANLDSSTSESILKMMKEINENSKTTFLFASHDPLVIKYVDRVIKIHDGELINDENIY